MLNRDKIVYFDMPALETFEEFCERFYTGFQSGTTAAAWYAFGILEQAIGAGSNHYSEVICANPSSKNRTIVRYSMTLDKVKL